MTRNRWLLLAALAAALVPLQHFALERTTEKRQEAEFTDIADLPPGEMVPTYVGSLFLGAFRALAIDILWIQLKEAQEDRRYYLAREIMEMISILQPRNEEVWTMLAWDAAYNVANGAAQRSEEEAWKWIRYGYLKLREGIRRNPNSPYLRYQLAYYLWHKPSWRFGRLDVPLLKRMEADDEVQRALQDLPAGAPIERKSMFELAMRWFNAARQLIEGRAVDPTNLFHRTQMGLYIRPDNMVGFMRECKILQAMYLWHVAKLSADAPEWENSKAAWAEVADFVVEMSRTYPSTSTMADKFLEYFRLMPAVIDASRDFTRVMTSKDNEAKHRALVAYVRALESVIRPLGLIENGYLLDPLSRNKQFLSYEVLKIQGREIRAFDENEYNDTFETATMYNRRPVLAGNFKPAPGDVDVYVVPIQEDHEGHGHGPGEHKFEPRAVTVVVTQDGAQPVQVRVLRSNRKPLEARVETKAREQIHRFIADAPGQYYVELRPLGEPDVLPADTRYRIAVTIE